MADFVRPGVLGELATFERVFGGPISRAQDRACSRQERELGEDRSRCVCGWASGWGEPGPAKKGGMVTRGTWPCEEGGDGDEGNPAARRRGPLVTRGAWREGEGVRRKERGGPAWTRGARGRRGRTGGRAEGGERGQNSSSLQRLPRRACPAYWAPSPAQGAAGTRGVIHAAEDQCRHRAVPAPSGRVRGVLPAQRSPGPGLPRAAGLRGRHGPPPRRRRRERRGRPGAWIGQAGALDCPGRLDGGTASRRAPGMPLLLRPCDESPVLHTTPDSFQPPSSCPANPLPCKTGAGHAVHAPQAVQPPLPAAGGKGRRGRRGYTGRLALRRGGGTGMTGVGFCSGPEVHSTLLPPSPGTPASQQLLSGHRPHQPLQASWRRPTPSCARRWPTPASGRWWCPSPPPRSTCWPRCARCAAGARPGWTAAPTPRDAATSWPPSTPTAWAVCSCCPPPPAARGST